MQDYRIIASIVLLPPGAGDQGPSIAEELCHVLPQQNGGALQARCLESAEDKEDNMCPHESHISASGVAFSVSSTTSEAAFLNLSGTFGGHQGLPAMGLSGPS